MRLKSEIISTVTAKRGGKDFELSFKTSIERENSEFLAEVYFENTYETDLKDTILTCYVPASYSIEKIDSQIRPKKEPSLEGMDVSFDLKKLSPKEKIYFNFTLKRNISRTVIISQGKEILIVRTYFPIIPETTKRYKSNLIFFNSTGKRMENVILEDVIPLEFSVVEFSAKNLHPYAREGEDTILKWVTSKFEKDDKWEITYILEPRKITRIIEKQLQLKDGRNIGRLTKIIEPQDEKGQFIVNIEFQNTTHSDLEDVKIEDKIFPSQKLAGATIEPEISTKENMSHIIWNFTKILENQSIEIYYLIEGKKELYKEIPEIEIKDYKSYGVRRVSTEQY
ncbi:MAG: hypothetical protein ACUVXA_15100 [Candidatus Jordarchaeum sp.]|uniref:hypothetical protein n=1 Tax=Candidatus Jordarchaeum sp. TaxID=2823881 RepID=UPI00404902D6